MDIAGIFITVIYQPFLNILVAFYLLLDVLTGGNPDMGVAVILLTILLRLFLLPMSLAGQRSEPARREISQKIREIHERYNAEPIKLEQEKKKVFKKSNKVLVSEVINLIVQIIVALMLYKIFATGLAGADLHLIYPFMPEITDPFNLLFLGKYDLTHSSITLNIIQSVLIFILETITLYTSVYPVSRREVVRMQLVLPLVSFIVFMSMPAGKKLFMITSLLISILLNSSKAIMRRFNEYKEQKIQEEEQKINQEEKLVVETK